MSHSNSQSRKRTHASTRTSSVSGRTNTSSPYNAEFEQKMIDNGIFPAGHRDAHGNNIVPANLEEVRSILGRQRESLSPSRFPDSAFTDFTIDSDRAQTESQAIAAVIPVLTGSPNARYHSSSDVVFNRLQKFDPDISSAKPDIYYGAQPSQIEVRVRQELGEYIVPSGQQTRPAAPNYFFEGKSASGRPDVARRQVMYDGALGARGMLQLQNYGHSAIVYDNNAYTICATYSDGHMRMYATHPRQATQAGQTDYYMTQLRSYTMTDTPASFRSGVGAFRNARDWTKEQRDRFIATANIVARSMPSETTLSGVQGVTSLPTSTQELISSETSEDEMPGGAAARKRRQE
nr:hypothetical protein CFP56_19584 [Quercus suber]